MLPFTPQQFFAVFADYNNAIWPSQPVAYLLGGVAVSMLFWQTALSDRVIATVLSAMWIWTGLIYHGIWFSSINKAAYLFAGLFVIEGGYLFYAGACRDKLRFGFRRDPSSWVGALFVGYAAIVYPLIGIAAGHYYPALPMFGVTPCPVTIFTFGMLLLTIGPMPRWLVVIPVIWSLIGGSAAVLLRVPQDWLLLFSGFIAVPLMLFRGSQYSKPSATPT